MTNTIHLQVRIERYERDLVSCEKVRNVETIVVGVGASGEGDGSRYHGRTVEGNEESFG